MIEFGTSLDGEKTLDRLRRLGVEAVLFDLDDTLIFTSEIFIRYMREFTKEVSERLNLDYQMIWNRLRTLNDEGYKKFGVSPTRWNMVLKALAEELKNEEVVMGSMGVLMKIYHDEPRLRPGAVSVLTELRERGYKLGLVTHANVEWTYRKLTQTGFLNFFDGVEIADENGFKSVDHWKKGMDLIGVCGKQCLVVGDNLKGDIVPAVFLGARAIWMPSPWSVYRTGEVPEGTVEMPQLSDFWEAVMKLN